MLPQNIRVDQKFRILEKRLSRVVDWFHGVCLVQTQSLQQFGNVFPRLLALSSLSRMTKILEFIDLLTPGQVRCADVT